MSTRPTRPVRALTASLLLPVLAAQEFAHHPVDAAIYVAQLRDAAPGLAFVQMGELAFDRHTRRSAFPSTDLARSTAFAAALRLQQYPAELLALLDAPDSGPRLRLLAAYALFRTADPHYLPRLGALATDQGELPLMPPYSFASGHDGEVIPKLAFDDLDTTTVGAEVSGWLQSGWQAPAPDSDEFTAWCERQQRLAPTAVELRLRMTFATGGGLTAGPFTPDDLLTVFGSTHGAPYGAQELAQLGLFHDRYAFCTHRYPDLEAHLCFAARRLGPDNLLRCMRGEPVLVDGDPVEAERIAGFENGVTAFVLDHPRRCGLGPEHTDAILELARSGPRPAAFIAAARLREADASAILLEGMERTSHPLLGGGNAAIAIALWEHDPDGSADRLAEWFLDDPAVALLPGRQETFAKHLLEQNRPADRALFRRLVRDERFARCGPNALQIIVRELERTQRAPIVPPESYMNFYHPYGIERAFRDLDAAKRDWPAQTQQMLDRMQLWRDRIREHVRDW